MDNIARFTLNDDPLTPFSVELITFLSGLYGVRIEELPSLYDATDIDSLDTLVASDTPPKHVEFRFGPHFVSIIDGKYVIIKEGPETLLRPSQKSE